MAGRAVTRVVHRCNRAKEERKLNLSECLLARIPDAIFLLMKNTTLESLDLSFNYVKNLPKALGYRFTHLTELILCDNKLISLPDEIKEMNELKVLDISHNSFAVFPKVVYKITCLTHLNAEKNIITEIEVPKLHSMKSLEEVNLKENPLPPKEYEDLQKIQIFVVHLTDRSEDGFDSVD